MWPTQPSSFFTPVIRAVSQLNDQVFLGVVARSVGWSMVCFIGLHFAMIWFVHRLLDLHGVIAWAADILGSVGASLLAAWLFMPLAAAIGTLYFDRIALAVERRYYPWLPPPQGAPWLEQFWDAASVAMRVLLLNMIALIVAVLLPGFGLLLGWGIAAYAIGRGLFVAVAMRRMPRRMAESLYAARRLDILLVGAIFAATSYIPLLNLLLPVLGTAAMVHVLDASVSAIEAQSGAARRFGINTY